MSYWKFLTLVTVFALAIASTAGADMVAYYPFNGNAVDESGNGHDGSELNGVALTQDRYGADDSAYEFDGQNDKIAVPDAPGFDITEAITLAAWMMPVEQKTQHIVRKGASARTSPYYLATSGTGDLIFTLTLDGRAKQLRKRGYPVGAWSHVVGTYDGATMRLYVNGRLEGSFDIEGTIHEDNNPLLIGTRMGLPADTFAGALDDVMVFDYALDEEAVIELYRRRHH